MVKNGHLIVLTYISFFNEHRFVFMRCGDIHGRTYFVVLCNASMKRNGQSATTYIYFTLTQIFSDGVAKIHLQLHLKFAVITSGIPVVSKGIPVVLPLVSSVIPVKIIGKIWWYYYCSPLLSQ